ncbi:ATP-grasp domain-containing protein [Yeosuana sp.]|uniref:ATP-grasp domain-containing protein n=1 Tax=Yeosuana sp. TaxID=2529388 RepID=UPI004054E2B8
MKQNILFTCAGRRNYLINYFKEALNGNGNVIAVDQDLLAPALVDADIAVQVPDIYDASYISKLLEITKTYSVTAIISLNDLELPLLSKNKSIFEKEGVKVIISDENAIDIGFDKLKTFNFIKKLGLNTPKTFTSLDSALKAIRDGELEFPLVLKPRWGSASIGIEFPESFEELELSYKLQKMKIEKTILGEVSKHDIEHSILIQEKLNGNEYGLDVVNDLEGNYFGTFAREKLSMRSGETDKAISVINKNIEKLGEKLARALKHIGSMDCDAFLVNGTLYLLELNPRFGGGYPFSHEAGVNLAAIYIEWLNGEENKNLLKYNNYKSGFIFSKCDRLLKIKAPKSYFDKSFEAITLQTDWLNFLKEVENYDFYHTYHYHLISKSEHETPVLITYKENDILIGIPFLIRNIPNTPYKDATCVYGYSGPISKNIPTGFDNSRFINEIFKYFKENNIISVFSRLNPYIENQHSILNDIGFLTKQGQVVNINIQLDLKKQKTNIQNRLKTYINNTRRNCSVRFAETNEDIQDFINIYYENMDRVGAKKLYYFSEHYFYKLFNTDVFKSEILLAIDNESGETIAGCQFITTNGIVQYHLSGTKNNYLHLNPTKLLIDDMRILATQRGHKYFNLGGGLGGRADDSLFHFKSLFSKDFRDFNLWKLIVNQDVYNELVAKNGITKATDYFPLYRAIDDLNVNL